MRIATWNLNNRVGKRKFRPEAADAAIAIDADVIVFTEFYPKQSETLFLKKLCYAGWHKQISSPDSSENANRVLIASRLPMERLALPIPLPNFDKVFPANVLAVRFPLQGLSVLGIRIPWYSKETAPLRPLAWEWLKDATDTLNGGPLVVIGDLNASTSTQRFKEIFGPDWQRATPEALTFFGNGHGVSEIDHILATSHCNLSDAECILEAGGFVLAGGPNALSDHAALVCRVETIQR